ncbi:MAG: D-aminoacylase [Alphaproteobacteria bacterium]|nr:D-aminoacylase [Alphaproteobacteria bacterium]
MRAARTQADTLFVDGEVVDGAGGAARAAAVGVRGDRIVYVGDRDGCTAANVISVSGAAICPGFIDVHTHDDQLLFDDPTVTPKLSQGVTTVIVGNCGVSLAPLISNGNIPGPLTEIGKPDDFRFAHFGAFLDALDAGRPAINAACFVGHTTLRVAHVKDLSGPATPSELAAMREACREALASGAIGVSSGLFYPPAQGAPPSEVIALVELVGAAGGIYAAHIRDESDHIIDALNEAIDIATAGQVPLIISHHKLAGAANFGRSKETLAHIACAATHHPIGFDVYPYAASSTMLNKASWRAAVRTLVTWSAPHPQMAGLDLSEAAARLGVCEEAALDRLSPGGGVYFMMDERDVRAILASPAAMIGSDGVPGSFRPHPRLWGTFPRVLGHYVRDVGLFSFEEAVRRMTALPAAQFHLADRGVIVPGAFADLTIVDREIITDRATFEHPTLPSVGVKQVWVNGELVWMDGHPTASRPGRVLRRRRTAASSSIH